MPRKPRIFVEGGVYHVYNRVASGEDVFADPNEAIELIEIIADGKIYRQYLNPGDAPEAFFTIAADQVTAREYCNLHGLWKA